MVIRINHLIDKSNTFFITYKMVAGWEKSIPTLLSITG